MLTWADGTNLACGEEVVGHDLTVLWDDSIDIAGRPCTFEPTKTMTGTETNDTQM